MCTSELLRLQLLATAHVFLGISLGPGHVAVTDTPSVVAAVVVTVVVVVVVVVGVVVVGVVVVGVVVVELLVVVLVSQQMEQETADVERCVTNDGVVEDFTTGTCSVGLVMKCSVLSYYPSRSLLERLIHHSQHKLTPLKGSRPKWLK